MRLELVAYLACLALKGHAVIMDLKERQDMPDYLVDLET